MTKVVMSGGQAVAEAVKLCRPHVIPVYPITPQTPICETLSQMVFDGDIDAELIHMESEHSAMAACIGASATGARTYTATSSQGLALMHEMLFVASGLRLPIVMGVANRSLSAPLNIWCFSEDAKVLMSDFSYKGISEIKEGDEVIGKNDKGCLVPTRVTKTFERFSDNLIKLVTERFELFCTPEHRFYHHPSHSHWVQAKNLSGKNLSWIGYGFDETKEFMRGWLAGVIDGDGSFSKEGNSYIFRINVKDEEIVNTVIRYASAFGFAIRRKDYRYKEGLKCAIISVTAETKRFEEFLKKSKNIDFCRGYLAGIYDAEGSGPFKVRQVVIYNKDKEIVETVSDCLDILGLSFSTYSDKDGIFHIKVNTVPEFFVKCRPILDRKRRNMFKVNTTLRAIKSRIKILDVISLHEKRPVYNIETGTHSYIVNGLLVHNCDQQDSMAERDAGWIQLYVEDAQEAFDTHIQAFRIAEQLGVPVMVCLDGFLISHTYETLELLEAAKARQFLPDFKPKFSLDTKKPITMGSVGAPDTFMDFRKQQDDALAQAPAAIRKANDDYAKVSGRRYGDGLLETVNLQGRKHAIMTLGSVAGTIRELLEKEGIGMIKVRSFRPFPAKEIVELCRNLDSVGVLEKDISVGAGGALFLEVKAALQGTNCKAKLSSFIAGLGGRDITLDELRGVMKKIKSGFEGTEWVGI